MLVERIVQLVREGCPIENMLVVTFTNAAAAKCASASAKRSAGPQEKNRRWANR